jgi:hypothetical protein
MRRTEIPYDASTDQCPIAKLYKEPQTHKMENFFGDYEIMQTVHQFLDARIPVIPMAV